MPFVTIKIAGSGTQQSDGTTSTAGHMWYSLDDGNGNTTSYGFGPKGDAWWQRTRGPGDVNAHGQSDDDYYLSTDLAATIEISQDQYDALKTFGEDPEAAGFDMTYNGLINSCVDFTWKALEKAGLNPTAFEGVPLPTANEEFILRYFPNGFCAFPLATDPNGMCMGPNLMDTIRDQFTTAEATKSPLILDLDGDGVETTGVKDGAYFDHGGDGFAEQTGWVGADDGLLVYDRNGNGTIESGAELFGDHTLLADGSRAANGFEALKELDSNLDGRIDVQDAAFANLRVWKDEDENGYTSDGELLSLAEVGVQSINTGYTNSTLVDANGNALKQTGSYTAAADGQTRTAADVWFSTDAVHTIATEWLAVPPDIAALPNLQGYGQVYDLHQIWPGV